MSVLPGENAIYRIFAVTTKLEILLNKSYISSGKNEVEMFFKKIGEIERGELPANYTDDGIQFFYKDEGRNLYFVACTQGNLDPIIMDEFLRGLHHITKFFLGNVTVELIRTNVVLMMEVLDEIVVLGYIQEMSPERLKPYIHTEPSLLSLPQDDDRTKRLFGIEVRPSGAHKSPLSPSREQEAKNVIYVDLIERVTADVNLKGVVNRLEIDGGMHIKSNLTGNPLIRLAINQDVEINEEGKLKAFGNYAQLDRCTFHHCVNLDEFNKRVLRISPPAGEFSAMTYTVTSDLPMTLPVRLEVALRDIEGSRDMNVFLRINLCVPKNGLAAFVKINLKVPQNTTGLSQQLGGQNQAAELTHEARLLWRMTKMQGGSEASANFRLINGSSERLAQSEVGPAVVDFEISEYTFTGLQVRWLKLSSAQDLHPRKLLRRVTLSNSFTVQLH